ncbi:hypothetical protein EIN_250110 [Entamoeba invadens IP1]|uniref:Rhodanese domain-containing protein n=1 Tax=Entamoeba invadens IP1 TaxID=370355 RepID=A0A0A1UH92_ENTIV|nr:hypothetical protein EIN_250110 [Entamoeba invadens IP1]ELP94917.1 hypothetical protein EIN_250110 [Entamoeba invadens IP1]|eukprot:XP_004261688.1 hypothetical protein EIN_250110 [Entamoeba invadens IP1]
MSIPIEDEYMDDETLIHLMKDGKTKIQIIDVRGSDLSDRMIRGAINIPNRDGYFVSKIPEILETYHTYDYIVVHCMRSVVRGPSCARKLKEKFVLSKYFATSNLKIVILSGGMKGFVLKHKEKEFYDYIH